MKKFLEKDLEEIIWSATPKQLEEKGLTDNFCYPNWKFRQLKIGNYGIADLVYVTKNYAEKTQINDFKDLIFPFLNIEIVELKKDKIGISSFLQAIQYAKGIHSYLTRVRNFYDFNISITLIGSELDISGSFAYLTDMIGTTFPFVTVDDALNLYKLNFITYNYNIDGIKFEYQSGYKLTDEGF